jgi:hypothetical protein
MTPATLVLQEANRGRAEDDHSGWPRAALLCHCPAAPFKFSFGNNPGQYEIGPDGDTVTLDHRT